MSQEYLGEEPGGRRLMVVAAVLALVAGVIGLGWWSQSTADSTNATLDIAVVDVQDQAAAGEAQVMGTLNYASPMIWSTTVSPDVRAGLRQLVQASAADVAGRLSVIRDAVADAPVLPWQADLARSRDRVLGLVDAYLTRFQQIARDAGRIGEVLGKPKPVAPALPRASSA